jgi:hypothetical protein
MTNFTASDIDTFLQNNSGNLTAKEIARAEQLKSWMEDKAVQDNIVESWLCVDCGVNTHPDGLDGPSLRIEIALRGGDVDAVQDDIYWRWRCSSRADTEIYSVHRKVWKQAGMREWSGCLCIGCLEQRLGRKLRRRDFDQHDADTWAAMPCTDRLADRRRQ